MKRVPHQTLAQLVLLGLAGFAVRRVVLYRAEPAGALSRAAAEALGAAAIDAALFFSPRTASTFVRLAAAAGLASSCRGTVAVALSPAVAAALGAAQWRRVLIAREPTQAALLDIVDRLPAVMRSAERRAADGAIKR